jgi:colanic acid/amylovoran biosynthesis protein
MQRNGPQLYTALLHMTLSKKAKLIVGPQTIGPLNSKIAQMLVAGVLRNAVCLCVREPCTFEYVIKHLGFSKSDVHLFPDLAFFETTTDQDGAIHALRSLGIRDNETIAVTTFLESNRFGVPEQLYFEVLGKASKYLHSKYGIRTVGIRQNMSAMGSPGDDDVLKRAAPYFGESAVMAYEFYPPEINRGIVSRCKITYGTRMHGNVYSLAQYVPAVAISYNHKTNGIMRMCGLEKYVVDLYRLESSRLIYLLDDLIANRETVRQTLVKVIDEFKAQRPFLIDLLRNSVNMM